MICSAQQLKQQLRKTVGHKKVKESQPFAPRIESVRLISISPEPGANVNQLCPIVKQRKVLF